MSIQKLTLSRLNKQQRQLTLDPPPNLLITRKDLLNFHFCIYGLDGAYKDGYYHGVLELAQDYPFAPPTLKFYTPSGRFQINKAICTNFTNFHKEEWSSAWNVRTMLMATVSFMNVDQNGLGGLKDSYGARVKYAEKSLSSNMQNNLFCQLFKDKIIKQSKKIVTPKTIVQQVGSSKVNLAQTVQIQRQVKIEKVPIQTNNTLYILVVSLILVLLLWGVSKRI